MSYNTRLQTHNESLRELLNTVNNLPSADSPSGSGGSGSGGADITGVISRLASSVSLPNQPSVGPYAFYKYTNLKDLDLPNCTSLGTYALDSCTGLTQASLPKLTTMESYAFKGCTSLVSVKLPALTGVSLYAFQSCESLEKADFDVATTVANGAFIACSALTALILRSTTMCALSGGGSTTFNGTPIKDGAGYIYVPKDLMDSYKGDFSWLTYANQIRAIEDYPEITGG